ALAASGAALVAADAAGVERVTAAPSREMLLAACRELWRTRWTRAETVACARVGRQWLVKVRLAGEAGRLVLQTRWTEDGGQWRLTEAEVARHEGPAGP